MRKKYFENVTKIGDLFLDIVFYEFEREPIIFICSDIKDNLYLCICSEIRCIQKWILTKINLLTLKYLIDEKIDLYSVYIDAPFLTAIEMDLDGNEKSYIINKESIDILDLPEKDTYLRCNKEKAINYLWNKNYERNSIQIKSSTVKKLLKDSYTYDLPYLTYSLKIERKNSFSNDFLQTVHNYCLLLNSSNHDLLNSQSLDKTNTEVQAS